MPRPPRLFGQSGECGKRVCRMWGETSVEREECGERDESGERSVERDESGDPGSLGSLGRESLGLWDSGEIGAHK